MSDTPSAVLDASAMLVYLQDETGADRVEEALGKGAAISAVNWAEVLTKLADASQEPAKVTKALTEQGVLGAALTVHSVDVECALEIAELRSATRRSGLSLGDRACLALGARLRLPVLTSDRAWTKLRLSSVVVEAIR